MSSEEKGQWQLFTQPAWSEWICAREGLSPVKIETGDRQVPAHPYASLHAFARKSGALRTPRLQPYLAAELVTTNTKSPGKLANQKLELCLALAEKMAQRGLAGNINLPSDLTDVRAWQWNGFRVEPFYTFILNTPNHLKNVQSSVRGKIKKAERSDYIYSSNPSSEDVVHCLEATANRKGFSYGLTVDELEQLRTKFPSSDIRCYLASTRYGEPVSSRVILRVSSTTALDWVAGTAVEHYQTGVTQKLISTVLSDLAAAGIASFDFGGANIPSVAKSKSYWGGNLQRLFSVSSISTRSLALDAMRVFKNYRS